VRLSISSICIGIRSNNYFEATRTTTAAKGIKLLFFQQYNNGIKVEHGVLKQFQKDIVQGFTAEYYNLASISATPGLSESAAYKSI
jgi:hypothetical protein